MRSRNSLPTTSSAVFFAALACLALHLSSCSSDPLGTGLQDDANCSSCHGGPENAAPPKGLGQETETTDLAVGAHQAHLIGGRLRSGISCQDCHIVPETIVAPGHGDELPAEVTWGPLSTTGGLTPRWLRENAQCSSVYCHGATLKGGTDQSPIWTAVTDAPISCDRCHGSPPPYPHPPNDDCHVCHPKTVLEDGTLDLVGDLHINGVVEADAKACNACHGNEKNAAPPVSIAGFSETTAVQVGAHQAHLEDGKYRQAISCSQCHVVPETVDAQGHTDASPAEIFWGDLAAAAQLTPAWDRDGATCASVYCHGASLAGGTNTTPTWTAVGTGQATCGSCHGFPPPAPHPANYQCFICHPGTVNPDGSIDVAGGKHIDGTVDAPSNSCFSCHGTADNPAPPPSLSGSTDTTSVTVGAHEIHLAGGLVRKGIKCIECHIMPGSDLGEHMDASPAEVVFGELATTLDLSPKWDREQETCSTTYCHGATLAGGTVDTPVWTKVNGSQSACDACHGNPPPSPHPGQNDCNGCHPDTVMPNGLIDLEKRKHINGTVELSGTACNACHGSQDNNAPPASLSGSDNTTDTEVGAHQSHVVAGLYSQPVACTECHTVPATLTDAGHLDESPAEVIFGKLSTIGGNVPEWDRNENRCSSTYCHGGTLSGGTNTAPVWNIVDTTQVGCDSCHGAPPPLPHAQVDDCAMCHGDTVNDAGLIKVKMGRHINGVTDVTIGACNTCHGSESGPAPPVAVDGATHTSDPGVGAHQTHVTAGPFKAGMWCNQCHQVPTTADDPGHMDESPAEIVWSALAKTGGADPQYDPTTNTCSSTYCHGTTLGGGILKDPKWTITDGSQAFCGSCHGWPPPAPHPQVENCFLCHPETVAESGKLITDNDRHVDGVLQIEFGACNSCHGNETNAAPPKSVGGAEKTSVMAVGAHQSHLKDGLYRKAVSCGSCHSLPGAAEDEGHMDGLPAEITWGELAKNGQVQPIFDSDSGLCSSTYCHGATLEGGTNSAPVWNDVGSGQSSCGACHGLPPKSAKHPDMQQCHQCHDQLGTNCSVCHPGGGPFSGDPPDHCNFCHGSTVNPDGSINVGAGFHIDGNLQIEPSFCGGCHQVPPPTGAHKVHFSALSAKAAYGDSGDTATTDPGSGGYAFNCGTCHPSDAGNHGNWALNAGGGTAEIDLSPTSAQPGTLKALNPPEAKYTPGPEVLLDDWGFAYTQGTCENVYCHSYLTHENIDPVPAPGSDFPFNWQYPIEYPDFATSTVRNYVSPNWGDEISCDGCHGFPPRTTSDTVDAGVVDSHSWIDDQGYENLHGWNHGFDALACAVCHYDTVKEPGIRTRGANQWSLYEPVPIDSFDNHVNGKRDVAFTVQPVEYSKTLDLVDAQYDPADRSCSSVSCHFKQSEVQWGAPYRWWITAECNTCHQY